MRNNSPKEVSAANQMNKEMAFKYVHYNISDMPKPDQQRELRASLDSIDLINDLGK